MTNTVFSLSTRDVVSLDAAAAIEIFRKLLHAESWRLGIPLRDVHISSSINVADGGIDASIEALNSGPQSNLFYPGPTTRYQIKTGSSFKPWQKSQLRKELFGSSSKVIARNNLADGIGACIKEGGTYTLICFGVDLVDKDRRKAKATLASLLESCGFESPKVDVLGAGELLSCFTAYPALSLEVSKRNDRFLSHTAWASTEEMQRPLQESESRALSISGIRDSLRDQRITHVRVCGEPGVGKTRLVLEAIREEDLSPMVVYWELAEEFLNSQQFHDIRSGHANYSAVLVIDECNFENTCRIWNVLKARPHSMPRIRLITIYHEIDESANSLDIIYPNVAPLEIDEITAILRKYGSPPEIARQYGELCSGSPRVAHIVGENLKENALKLTSLPGTMGDVWTRYIGGRLQRDSERHRQIKFVLEYISLFKKFGYRSPVNHEADAVFRLVNESDPRLGRGVFDDIVRDLRHRRILQGETTLYISPKLFHIWLWCEWWETHGHRPDVLAIIQNLPTALIEWFGQMFMYAHDSKAAIVQVNNLLGPEGPFANEEVIRTDLGGRFFFSLAEASPSEALKCLERSVGTWNQNLLREFKSGRREVVAALERIAYDPRLFSRAAKLILQLAGTENEHWANNASGVFKKLFSLRPGRFSPTAASPAERFPILEEALDSPEKTTRRIGLEACKQTLEQIFPPVIVERRPYGSHHQVQSWNPTNTREIIDATTHVWKLLEAKVSHLTDEDERELARTILIEQGPGLLSISPLVDMVFDTFDNFAQFQFPRIEGSDEEDHSRGKILAIPSSRPCQETSVSPAS